MKKGSDAKKGCFCVLLGVFVLSLIVIITGWLTVGRQSVMERAEMAGQAVDHRFDSLSQGKKTSKPGGESTYSLGVNGGSSSYVPSREVQLSPSEEAIAKMISAGVAAYAKLVMPIEEVNALYKGVYHRGTRNAGWIEFMYRHRKEPLLERCNYGLRLRNIQDAKNVWDALLRASGVVGVFPVLDTMPFKFVDCDGNEMGGVDQRGHVWASR